MNINTLSKETIDYKSVSLPIALYPNAMRRKADGKQTYYARAINRSKLYMEDIASDMVVAGVNNGLSKEQIVAIWNNINSAVFDRVANSNIVDCGLGVFGAKLNGTFETESDSFNHEKHSIDIGFHSNKAVREQLKDLQVVIRQGNTIRPQISDVYDLESGGDERLTKGGFLEIAGTNLSVQGEDASVGLYFENVDDDTKTVKLDSSKMGINSSNRLACVVPTTLTAGNYKIRVVTQFTKTKNLRKEPVEFMFDKLFTVE